MLATELVQTYDKKNHFIFNPVKRNERPTEILQAVRCHISLMLPTELVQRYDKKIISFLTQVKETRDQLKFYRLSDATFH